VCADLRDFSRRPMTLKHCLKRVLQRNDEPEVFKNIFRDYFEDILRYTEIG
jgi:hypothetical protein